MIRPAANAGNRIRRAWASPPAVPRGVGSTLKRRSIGRLRGGTLGAADLRPYVSVR